MYLNVNIQTDSLIIQVMHLTAGLEACVCKQVTLNCPWMVDLPSVNGEATETEGNCTLIFANENVYPPLLQL